MSQMNFQKWIKEGLNGSKMTRKAIKIGRVKKRNFFGLHFARGPATRVDVWRERGRALARPTGARALTHTSLLNKSLVA
jgi:hypothetical protein